MNKPELVGVSWLAPNDIMERVTHRFGKCSVCGDVITVEKTNPYQESDAALMKAFKEHVETKHKS